jgi:hypothetical protein
MTTDEKLFQRALRSIARPAPNPPIIEAQKAGKKKPAKATKKSGGTD